MNFIDLIEKKKQGRNHSNDEIHFIANSFCDDSVSEAQISAWLMAVNFKGLSADELSNFVLALASTGQKLDFSESDLSIVDKSSTAGVGDKVSIALFPLLAASGVSIINIEEKGIGFSAGVIDKLEAIPGFNSEYSKIAIINQIKSADVIIACQPDTIAPAENKMSLLMDTTATADSKELITAAILSKKIAAGADNIFIDIKYGSGAIIKTPEDAHDLSTTIIDTARRIGKTVTVIITSMEEPIGRAVGNSIEVIEAVEFLKGNIKDGDFAYLTYYIASQILVRLDIFSNVESAHQYLEELVESGKALDKFKEIITIQGGKSEIIESYDSFELPSYKIECASKKEGFIQNINAKDVSRALKALGGMRTSQKKNIDHSVGIFLNKKSGEYVVKGETLYTIYSNDEEMTQLAQSYCDSAFVIDNAKPLSRNIVYKVIGIEEEDV